MATSLKNAFNAVRTKLGMTPLFVQTSPAITRVTYEGPLAQMFGMNASAASLMKMRMVAEATSSLRPEKNPWKVGMEIGNFGIQPVAEPMSYTQMLSFMKEQEITAARDEGLTGTDADIIAKRKPAVSRSNVLNFAS